MTTLNAPSSPKNPSATQSLRDSIVRVRHRLLMRGVLWWVGCVAGLLAIGIALDFLVHFGPLVRWVMLGVVVWVGVLTFGRWILRARSVALSPSDMALNLSRPAPTLAALVDLPKPDPDEPMEHALRQAIESRSARHIDPRSSRATLRARPLYEMAAIGIGLIAMLAMSLNRPSVISIGARRMLIPWTDAQWPMRFGISLPEVTGFHPSDRAFIAGAFIGPSTDDPGASVRWRLMDSQGDPVVRWTALTLNPQGAKADGHQRYEQLIPIHMLSAASIPKGATLEYRIETRDDRSPTQRVSIVHPPRLEGVFAKVTLPEYASDLESIGSRFIEGERTLQPSLLSLGPVLAGSSIHVRWAFDSPIRTAQDSDSDSNFIEMNHTLSESRTITTVPLDEYGLSPRAPMDVFVRVVADAPPEALITDPSTDLVVGQRAIVDVAARIIDDIGLAHGSIVGIEPDASSDADRLLSQIDPEGSREQTIAASIDIQALGLAHGEQLEVRALATDILGLDTRSTPRIIRIVEDKEIVDRVEQQLGSIGEILRRLDDRQRELIGRLQEGPNVESNDQAALTDQIESRAQATRALVEQLEQSRIEDAQLSPMLDMLNKALDEAREQSERAAESLDREQDQQANERMQDVREELGDAIAMLDRGQDTWLARRAIEELRSQVEGLLDDTNQLGAQTGGRSIDQLSEDERSMLQKILDKQRRVTQDARETIDALDAQADALDENNPTGAQGIRDAATQGRNSGIEEQLAQAGDEIAQNQTSSAAGTQQQVLEELDKMLEQIEQAQKNRDSALRRKLASIMESIKAIIEDQTHELARLDQGEPNLDIPMIALRDNTLGIRDDAGAAFPETQSIADSLTSAAESQGEAITALRSNPADLLAARQSELSAITHMQAALDEAERQDEMAADRQSKRLRDELRKQYQESLKAQSTITTETQPLVGQNLDRRQRAKARQLGGQEDGLREQLKAMLNETQELSEAPIFALAHDQLELLLQAVADNLSERSLDPMIVHDQQSVATILTALIDVLGDSQQPQSEDFEDGQSGGGGGQGGGGDEPVIPPIAQLQLLKTLQQLTATQTRALNESDAQDTQRIDQIGRLQRDLAEKGQQLIEEMNQEPQPDEQPREEPNE